MQALSYSPSYHQDKDRQTQTNIEGRLFSLLSALHYPTPQAKRRYYRCRCPVEGHGNGRGDLNPSLIVTPDSDRILVHCHVGCRVEDVLEALGLEYPDLYAGPLTGKYEATREPTEETLRTLAYLKEWWWGARWKIASHRDIYLAITEVAGNHGWVDEAGVHVSISHRDLALAAGVTRRTVGTAVKRMRENRLIATPNQHRQPEHAGTFTLLVGRAATSPLAPNNLLIVNLTECSCGEAVARGGEVPERMRAAVEVHGYLVKSVGKRAGAALDYLLRRGGSATVTELGEDLDLSRPRDARKHVGKLEDSGLVLVKENRVVVEDDLEERIEEHREASGQIASYRMDKAQYLLERVGRWEVRGKREDEVNKNNTDESTWSGGYPGMAARADWTR